MSKTTFNRIENNLREASEEEIHVLAQALETTKEVLTQPQQMVNFNNNNFKGNGNGYIKHQQNQLNNEVLSQLREELQTLKQHEEKWMEMITDIHHEVIELLKRTSISKQALPTIGKNTNKD